MSKIRNIAVSVPQGPAEFVEADHWAVSDRTLTFRKGGEIVKQYNNRDGWLSWEFIGEVPAEPF